MSHLHFSRTIFSWLALIGIPALAATDPKVELVGQWGGLSSEVVTDGNLAYLAIGPRVVVLDITDPAQPKKLGQSSVLPRDVLRMVLGNGHLYVANQTAGLQILELSNPFEPRRVGGCKLGSDVRDVAVQGSFAYVVDDRDGFHIVDVTDPRAPRRISGLPTKHIGSSVDVSGSFAYVCSWYWLEVIDVTDPYQPVKRGACRAGDWEVVVRGGYAFVVGHPSEDLQIFYVSNPDDPRLVGHLATDGWLMDLALSDNLVFLANGSWPYGLQIADISNPLKPVLLGSRRTTDYTAGGVAVGRGHAFLVDWKYGLHAFDVANPREPRLVGIYDDFGHGQHLAVADGWVYLTGYREAVDVIDARNRNQLVRAVAFSSRRSNGIAIDGYFAYVTQGTKGLEIMDISDPTAPRHVSQLSPTEGEARDVAIAAGRAHIANHIGGLLIADVSDPARPRVLGSCPVTGYALSVSVAGSLAYVGAMSPRLDGAYSNSLEVIDIRNPQVPVRVGLCDLTGQPHDIAMVGQYVYAAGTGLDIVDVSNPVSPLRVGRWPASNSTYGVAVMGDYAYVAMPGTAVFVIDVSDPHAPRAAAQYKTSGWPFDLAVAGGYLYIADDSGGLVVAAVHIPGDMNCDGSVNRHDIDPFVIALTNAADYRATFPDCHWTNADTNADGVVDNFDIDPFVKLLTP